MSTPPAPGSERSQRHADDVQATGEPAERELADVLAGGSDLGEVTSRACFGRRQRGRDGREHLAEGLPDELGGVRLLADRLPQIPDAVSDVASLVVMDL